MFKSIKYLLTITIVMIFLVACSKDNAINPSMGVNKSEIQDRYIVVVDAGTSIQTNGVFNSALAAKTILESHNISNDNTIFLYDRVLQGFCANLTPSQVSELNKDKRIKYIEKDAIYKLTDYVVEENPKQSKILTQMTPWGINSVGGAVDATSTTGVAWIVDTGIYLTHTDLNVNTTLARTFVTYGQDATTANDFNGHGTHCAGIIGAKNNTVGTIGVCAGATVIPVKVLDQYGSGYTSTIISGLNYVANNLVSNKTNVVNLSFGGDPSTSMDDAVKALANAGAYVVIAAGNSSSNAGNYSPARVEGTRIYTVSAFSSTGAFASFSNYGNGPVDYSAPGVSIYSTYRNGGYATMSGTSMSAPHVAGILLANDGTISYSGNVTSDPDGTADPKAHR